MKVSNIFKYGFLCCLVWNGISFLQPVCAQEKDSIAVTEFTTSGDSITITDSSGIRRSAQDSLSAIFSNSSGKINWDSILHKHSPRRAGLYSAVFPGLGQLDNQQYIKVPIMWAAMGVAVGVFVFNFDHYTTYRDAYRLRVNGKMTGDPKVDIYNEQDLKFLRDGYRKYVDYSVLGFAAVYLYNILDAVVFGYFFNFDVESPISGFRFGPVIHQDQLYTGIGLTYHF